MGKYSENDIKCNSTEWFMANKYKIKYTENKENTMASDSEMNCRQVISQFQDFKK